MIMAANARKSKKRSAASSPSQPKRFVFFTDANLGRRIVPEALRRAGEEVIAHDDRFQPGTRDATWLREAGRNGWVVLTKDSKIRYRRNEMQALLSSGARSFVLVSSNLPGIEIANIFIIGLSAMKKLCEAQPAPFIAHVHRDGTVVLMRTLRRR
jgi:predicted nuclease of predicted toxin-antitoxin system